MVSNTKSLIQQDLQKKYNKTTLTKREYAKEIGVSISTVDAYLAKDEGIPKYIKLGNSKNSKVLFNIVDVADFLANGATNVEELNND